MPMCGVVLLSKSFQDLLFLCRAEQSDVLVLRVKIGRLPAVDKQEAPNERRLMAERVEGVVRTVFAVFTPEALRSPVVILQCHDPLFEKFVLRP